MRDLIVNGLVALIILVGSIEVGKGFINYVTTRSVPSVVLGLVFLIQVALFVFGASLVIQLARETFKEKSK